MDRPKWYYRQQVDSDWLDSFIDNIEEAERNIVLALTTDQGVRSGLVVSERGAGQDFSVDITGGLAWDTSGRRIEVPSTQNLSFVNDIDGNPITVVGSGNSRIVTVFIRYKTEEDPTSNVVDGFGSTVATLLLESFAFELIQGDEVTTGTEVAPSHPGSGLVKLANVSIHFGDSTIADADIDTDDRDVMTPFA